MKNKNSTIETINRCARLLIEQHLTIGFAESATCGHISSSFSLADNAGKFLKGGIACYDAAIKANLLRVDRGLIEQHSPESAEVTKEITIGATPLLDVDICIGCTGLTCKGGSETDEKPVGTMFLHGIHHNETIFAERIVFGGDQRHILERATDRAAHLLLQYLEHKSVHDQQKHLPKNGTDDLAISWP
jgi:nicotinamide-nucleotide amidase